MLLLKNAEHLQGHLKNLKNDLQTIGFVPTMGALHDGHVSLLAAAAKQCDYVVCSIFVNPSQFNELSDLDKYPRTPEHDIEKLAGAPCNLLFLPSVETVYPAGWKSDAPTDFGFLTQTMEATHRPGHFEGVAKVVKRLLDLVQPDKIFMGQKDFQQCAIVSEMVRILQIPVEVVCCETVKEPDGLAMSSRNMLLSNEQRIHAPALYQSLLFAKEHLDHSSIDELEQQAIEIQKKEGFETEYFSIVDGSTLKPITDLQQSNYIVACTAGRLGTVRLIDNLVLRREF